MKHYLYITPYFPTPQWHSGVFSYDFVKALERNSDFRVTVFLPGAGADYVYHDVTVYRFPRSYLPTGILPLAFARHNAKMFLKKLAEIGIDPADVAYVHLNYQGFGAYADALKKINPHVVTILQHHDLSPFGLRLGRLRHVWMHKVINFFAFRRLYERIDLHVFISEASRRSMLVFPDTSWSVYEDYRRLSRGLTRFRRVRLKDSYVMHNGVDMRLFNRTAKVERTDGEFVIGCVANFIEVKDNLLLIRAVEKLRGQGHPVRLRFKGTSGFGQFLFECQQYVSAHHLSEVVSFEPNCAHEELPRFYGSIDLFAMPSFFEGFGCVYTEAWACGTPFIACEGQGIEDVLSREDRKLWLAHPRDVDSLVRKIESYVQCRPQQKLCAPIDIDSIVKGYVRKLEEVK